MGQYLETPSLEGVIRELQRRVSVLEKQHVIPVAYAEKLDEITITGSGGDSNGYGGLGPSIDIVSRGAILVFAQVNISGPGGNIHSVVMLQRDNETAESILFNNAPAYTVFRTVPGSNQGTAQALTCGALVHPGGSHTYQLRYKIGDNLTTGKFKDRKLLGLAI